MSIKNTMIPVAEPTGQPDHNTEPFDDNLWPILMAQSLRKPADLLAKLGLTDSGLAIDPHSPFALRVPEPFIAQMQRGNPTDPLLRQVLPLQAERLITPELSEDPLQEQQMLASPGLLHKYQGRALMISTGACAVHCRYCFRRHFPYQQHKSAHQAQLLEHIRKDTSLTEVILSGGDPLMLADKPLAKLLNNVAQIPHVQRIRLHSRVPVVLPQRVDQSLVRCLTQLPVPVVLVIHANHPNELSPLTARAMAALHHPNLTLLNQSVLLADINDNAATLCALSEALFGQGVMPYYLHLTDDVQGTAHFMVPAPQALALHAQISARLPGYLVPKLVQELPGQPAKTLVQTNRI